MVEINSTWGLFRPAKFPESVGVEFASGSLRLAIVKAIPSGKEVVALVEKNIQSLSEEDTVLFISQFLSKHNAKSSRAIYIVPSEMVITKNIELPSRDPKEIQDIVNLQASRHTPYGREEITVDFINLGLTSKNYTKIMLVIVNREVVRRNFEILKHSGIEPEKISFSSEAMAQALSQALKHQKDPVPYALIHVDTAFTVCNVFLADTVIFIRSIPLGIQQLTIERERQKERLLEEIRQSLEVYRSENIDAFPSRLIITGALAEVQDLAPLLSDALRIPCENLSYANCFSFDPSARAVAESAKLSSFLGVISAAVNLDAVRINLVPEEAKLKRVFQERSRELIYSGFLLLLVFIFGCGLLLSRIYFKGAYLQKLNARFQTLHEQAQVLETDFERIRLIRQHLMGRGLSLRVIGEFYRLLPEQTLVTELNFDKAKEFRFKGKADNRPTILAFVDDLNKSGVVSDAKTRSMKVQTVDGKEVVEFEIVATFSEEE